MIPDYRSVARHPRLVAKEKNWCVASRQAPLKSYSALEDHGLWHHFANPVLQPHLLRMGFLTPQGELRDIDKHRRKWHVMEHELFLAERLDQQRQREAQVCMEQQTKMRQIARYQAIRDAEVQSTVHRIREQRRMKQEPQTTDPRTGAPGQPAILNKTQSTPALHR